MKLPHEPWSYGLWIPRDPRAVGIVRGTIRSILRAARLDCMADATELLASEVVTNFFRHSGCQDAVVGIDWVPDDLRVTVLDTGTGVPRRVDAGPDSERGRGLALVEAYAEEWGVDTLTDRQGEVTGKAVWFSMAPGHGS